MSGPLASIEATTRSLVTALLIARGCPEGRLVSAVDWLGNRRIPAGPVQIIGDIDHAIAYVGGPT